MPTHELWLPNPPKGTRVCAGFDGSENDDWTCIKMETLDGLIFTPLERYGLAKPQQNRKIDAAVTSVLAHEAACDARAAGWGARKHNYMLTGSSTRRRY